VLPVEVVQQLDDVAVVQGSHEGQLPVLEVTLLPGHLNGNEL